ncbi:hypothetical protein Q3G72_004067 [Acer saccharum]|nr:hypothetical protein Q3G72_004067 [Acer saccharum]
MNANDESVIATGILDIWANDEGEGGNKAKKVSKPSVIPAVEVEAPGCSVSSMEVITLPDIIQEIAEEDEENKKRHLRLVAKQEN